MDLLDFPLPLQKALVRCSAPLATYPEVVSQWEFQPPLLLLHLPVGQCQLCFSYPHQHLFTIYHTASERSLAIGFCCMRYLGSHLTLSPPWQKAALPNTTSFITEQWKQTTQIARRTAVCCYLELKIGQMSDWSSMKNCLIQYGGLAGRDLLKLLNHLPTEYAWYLPRYVRVLARSRTQRTQLRHLHREQIIQLWPFFSESQIQWLSQHYAFSLRSDKLLNSDGDAHA